MIKYSLRCDHDHLFEGWFRNSEDCEAQINGGHVECPYCASVKVSKSLMAPRVSGTRTQDGPSAGARQLNPVAGQEKPAETQVSVPTSSGAPASVPSGAGSSPTVQGPSPEQVRQILKSFREHVVKNADYVGDKFAEEARKMHFKEKEERGIYGEATMDEVKSLAEDGIDCMPMPVLPEDQN